MKGDPGVVFEEMYRSAEDPWDFASSWYERRRYDATTALLPDERYRRAFEPGCSVGELTRRLSERCDAVIAWDASASAVARAGRVCAGCPGVELGVGTVPGHWPDGSFDLVVLSEIGYYVDRDGVARLRDRAIESLDPGGVLIAVHWLGHSADHVLHGDDVHEVLLASPLDHVVTHRDRAIDPGFRTDVWRRSA